MFRDILNSLCNPTPWLGISFFISLILLIKKKFQLLKWQFPLTFVLFFILSSDVFTYTLLNSVERIYPEFSAKLIEGKKIQYVVVLAGGYISEPEGYPLSSKLPYPTLVRIVEGIKIYRKISGSKLIFTGNGNGKETEALGMKRLALELGVADQDIILETNSQNTHDHTIYLKPTIKNKEFILVTSAFHMSRAMKLFQKAGMAPIAAPTGHINVGDLKAHQYLLPFSKGENLHAMDAMATEICSTILAWLKGWI